MNEFHLGGNTFIDRNKESLNVYTGISKRLFGKMKYRLMLLLVLAYPSPAKYTVWAK